MCTKLVGILLGLEMASILAPTSISLVEILLLGGSLSVGTIGAILFIGTLAAVGGGSSGALVEVVTPW